MLLGIANLVIAGVLGLLLILCVWPTSRVWRIDLPLLLPLGLGAGLGLTSQLFFWCSLLTVDPRPWLFSIEAGGIIASVLWLRRRHREQTPVGRTGEHSLEGGSALAFGSVWQWLLASVFAQACVAGLGVVIAGYRMSPHGSIDAWAIWTMHARFMWLGGPGWPESLASPHLDWSHPDYPLLVSGGIARGWTLAGADTTLVAGAISIAFAAGTVVLLVASAARLTGTWIAMLGGLALLGTPFFLTSATDQYADIPLGFYLLATVVVLRIAGVRTEARGLPVIAGLLAGLAAWTKNEGLLFCMILLPVVAYTCHRRRAWAEFGWLLAGWGVAILPLLYFKLKLAASNDLVAVENTGAVGRLWEWERYQIILAGWWRWTRDFGRWDWGAAPWIVLTLALLGADWRRRLAGAAGGIEFVVLVLMHVGYFCVYLITPHDLRWHLASSLDRLFLQLWPLTLFVWCLAAGGERQASASGQCPCPTRTTGPGRWLIFGAANLVVATTLVGWIWR